MTIRYFTTRGDLLVANLWSILHNRYLLVLWSLVTAWACYDGVRGPDIVARGIAFQIVFTVFTAIFYLVLFASLTFVLIGIMVLLRQNKGVIGEHRLTISDDGLIEATAYNESLNRWPAYHRTVSTRRYLMLYVTEGQLHIVSKRRPLLEGDLEAFEAALNQKTKTRGAATPE